MLALMGEGIIWELLTEALLIWGAWLVMKKCERKPWLAIIPGVREYQLAKCCDREADGRRLLIATVLMYLLQIIDKVADVKSSKGLATDQSIWFLILLVVQLSTIIMLLVYMIRIFGGLCDLFGYKRKWMWFIVLISDSFLLLLWGLRKKCQPKYIYKDDIGEAGAAISGRNVKVLDSGLTVNIEERTAGGMLKKNTLLRDIHLNIEPGHMVLLLGGSGVGKTTFVNAVIGYEKAKANMVLNGNNIYDNYDKMKYRIGFVPQMDLMRVNDTVIRTLMDAAKLRLPASMSVAERRERATVVLKFFGLEPVKDKLCEKLSGGQRKRLSIAMEYISNPDLFVLDEPDSGLDGVMARELMQGLRNIANQGKIVIVITHSPDRVIDLFDDVIVLAKDSRLTGRLAYFGPVDQAKQFFERDNMERIVLRINRKEEGGEGLADSFIERYAEVCNG